MLQNSLRSCQEHHAAATHYEAGDYNKAEEARGYGDTAVEHGKKGHEISQVRYRDSGIGARYDPRWILRQ
jgi:hypothetical protein